MPRFRSIVLVLAVAALVAAALPAIGFAQDQTPAAPSDSAPAPPPVQPIATPDVSLKAEQTSATLREIRSNVGRLPEISGIDERFLDLSSEVDSALTQAEGIDVSRITRDRLNEELQAWQRRRNRLTEWQNTIRKRSETLDASRQEIRAQREVWGKTEEASRQGEVPQAIAGRITSILARIDSVDAEISARLDTVLTLQDGVSEKLVLVDEVIQALHETQGRIQLMILKADSPPLWSALFAPADSATIATQARDVLQTNVALFVEYVRLYSSRFRDQLIVFALLLAAFVALAWRSRRWPTEDEDMRKAVGVVRRPVASALVIALLSSVWFHPEAPSSVRELFQLLVLLPLIRLIPVLAKPENWKPLYVIVVIFAFDQILSLAGQGTILQRLMQIGLASISLAGLAWLQRRAAGAAVPRGGRELVVIIARIVFVLIAISLLGNVFGFVALANYLLRATLTSGYLGLVVMAAYQIVVSVLAGVLQTNTARRLHMVRIHAPLVKDKLARFLRLFLIGLWIWIVLSLYGIWDETSSGLISALGREWTIGSISLSVGDIAVFFLAIWLAVQVSKLVQFVLGEDILPRMKLPRGVPSAISRVSGILIVGFGFMLACAAAGVDLNQFTLLAGALGVGVGFGMQNLVNNFISGMILIFERPISAGDLVQFGTMWGTVQRIGFRSCTIRTFSGADVIVPNGNLISQEVTNWSRTDQLRRVELTVGLAYGTNPNRVIEILEGVGDAHPDILKEPKPYVVFHGFGESSLDFELRAWTRLEDWLRVCTEARVMMNNALNEAGLVIPFPQRDLHLKSIAPDAREVVKRKASEPESDPKRIEPESEPEHVRRPMEGQGQDSV